jgi:pyrroline-5-carboxylate reductase
MIRIGFIGTGNIATALIRNLKANGNYNLISSDKNEEKLEKAEKELGIETTKNNKDLTEKSDIIFLCAKPKDINEILQEIKESVENKIVISIAAGITINSIEEIIGKNKKIVRVMPNINCTVGEMAAAYAYNENINKSDKEIINGILNKSGTAIEIKEEKMDCVTALSGSGPAFVAYVLDGFASAGEKQGLNKEDAYKLALQTFFGTASLLKQKNISPEELIKRVSSPGGTTVAGLEVFERLEIKKIIDETIKAAVERSKELGK